jgi:hypothetical protein
LAKQPTTETLARHLVSRLYEATEGRSEWCMVSGIKLSHAAVELAVERGWLLIDQGSVCLTEAGRALGRKALS